MRGGQFIALIILAALILTPRLIDPLTTVTSDEGYWMQRTVRFGAAIARGDLSQTFRSGHPGVTTMWVGLLGLGPEGLKQYLPVRFTNYVTLERDPGYLSAFAATRRAIALVGIGLLVGATALTWRLLGPGAALLGSALVALDPYLLGSSQVFHVDTLLAPFMILALLSAIVYWCDGRQQRFLWLTGVMIGLALLTKAPAATLPIYVSSLALFAVKPWRSGWRAMLPLIGCGVIAALTYAALWPAIWVEPVRRLGQVYEFARTVGGNPHTWPNFFLGQSMTGDPGPFFYPIALAFRLSPVALIGLILLPLAYQRRLDRVGTLVTLLGFTLFFIALMSIGAKKFDRYMLPAITILVMLAGASFWWVSARMRDQRVRLAIAAGVILAQACLLWRAEPYPIAAYSPLMGGTDSARRMMMVGWGEGLDQVAAYLNAQPNPEYIVAATHYHHVLRPLFHGATVRIVQPVVLDYYVVYINMLQRGLISPTVMALMDTRAPDFTAVVDGVEYAWVYRINGTVDSVPENPTEGDED